MGRSSLLRDLPVVAAPCPYTRVGCFPLQVAAGGVEPVPSPLRAPGTGPKRRV